MPPRDNQQGQGNSTSRQTTSDPAPHIPSRSASSTTAVADPDTRLSKLAHGHRALTVQAHQYPVKTYLQGMGTWLPTIIAATSEDGPMMKIASVGEADITIVDAQSLLRTPDLPHLIDDDLLLPTGEDPPCYHEEEADHRPPLQTAANRETLDRGSGSIQSQRTVQNSFERHPDNVVRQTPTSMGHDLLRQGLTPMERFEAESVFEQPFSSARVNINHKINAGERQVEQVDKYRGKFRVASRSHKKPEAST